jgi:mRNA interferase RelE/StbE
MADYAVTFARSARRELEGLEHQHIARVLGRIEGLAAEPRPSGAKKLQGSQQLWRIRVGDYRIVYAVNDRQRVVDVVRIRHRRDVYR